MKNTIPALRKQYDRNFERRIVHAANLLHEGKKLLISHLMEWRMEPFSPRVSDVFLYLHTIGVYAAFKFPQRKRSK
jgi:hypothetical protein